MSIEHFELTIVVLSEQIRLCSSFPQTPETSAIDLSMLRYRSQSLCDRSLDRSHLLRILGTLRWYRSYPLGIDRGSCEIGLTIGLKTNPPLEPTLVSIASQLRSVAVIWDRSQDRSRDQRDLEPILGSDLTSLWYRSQL